MALSDIDINVLCSDTVTILEDWDETLTIRRLGSPVALSYDSTGSAVRTWQVIGTFLGDWQPVSGNTQRAEQGLKKQSDAVVFGPCSLDVVENDRIYRADGSFEYVNYVRVQEDHYEIFLTRVQGSD